MPADLARIRGNVASILDQGGTEAEVETYLASEDVTAQDLRTDGRRLPPEIEKGYVALARDPKSTAADLVNYARKWQFEVDPDEVEAFIAKREAAGGAGDTVEYRLAPTPTGSNTFRQDARAVAGSFVDGVLPGSAKFVRGSREVLLNAIRAPFTEEDFAPAAAYARGAEDQELAQARFERDHPTASSAIGWGGTAAGLVTLPEAKVVKGGTLIRGALNSGANGVLYGALSGAMNDTGGGRLENAGWGALAGGGLGAASPVLLRKGADVVSAARRTVPGIDGILTTAGNGLRRATGRAPLPASHAADAQAERLLAARMQDATISTGMGTGHVPATPANVADEVTRRQSLGVPAMPADVSEPLRSSLTSVARRGEGRMSTRAREAVQARQAQQGSRVRGHIVEELGPAVDPIAEAEAISRRASNAARPHYQAAYAQPIVVTPEMQSVMQTPAFREAVGPAVRNILNDGRDPMALGFRLDPSGNVTALDTLSTEGFDHVIRAMRDNGRDAAEVNPLTGRVTHNTQSSRISARADDLRDELAAQNGHYAQAVQGYADEMAVRDAMRRGADVGKLSGPEIAAQARTMPQHAQEAWTAGARTQLADDAVQAGLQPAADVAQRTRQSLGLSGAGLSSAAGDTVKRDAIEALSDRPGSLGRLDDRLEAEHQGHETFRSIQGALLRDAQDAQQGPGIAGILSMARKAAQGRIVGALSEAAQGLPQGTLRFRRDVQERTADLLSRTDPQAMREGMGAIADRVASDQAVHTRLNRTGQKIGRTGALFAAAQNTAPDDAPEESWRALAGPDLEAPLYSLGSTSQPKPAAEPKPLPKAPPAIASRARQGREDDVPHVEGLRRQLDDGRVLTGFQQRPDGTFVPEYTYQH